MKEIEPNPDTDRYPGDTQQEVTESGEDKEVFDDYGDFSPDYLPDIGTGY